MKSTIHDVFLSYSMRDSGLAALARENLENAGLSVFELAELSSGTAVSKTIRQELVDSFAVVLLLTPSSEASGNLAFEAGMAMAWGKPVFVLHDGRSLADMPNFISQFNVYPLNKIDVVSHQIIESKKSLSPEHKEILKALYLKTAIPADRLLLEPVVLHDMAEEFELKTKLRLPAADLARELIRLRKIGQLPPLKHVVQTS